MQSQKLFKMSKTIIDKIWESHIIKEIDNQSVILYIDRHYIHEVTSPQAFSSLDRRGVKVFRPDKTFATCDHNIPTVNQANPELERDAKEALERLQHNTTKNNISYFPLNHKNNGIVHIIGPQLGITQCGMTIVCGDSHTSTHGALGNIAFGIGTSEVEMVLATQSIIQNKPKQMLIEITGNLSEGVEAKDIILYIISQIGTSGGTGYFVEFTGETISNLSIEERMTICNMSIEMGARGGIIAPDIKTLEFLHNKEYSPKGEQWSLAKERWLNLKSDKNAYYHKKLKFDISNLKPMVTYGTNPAAAIEINNTIPYNLSDDNIKGLEYMGFKMGEKMEDKTIDYIFVGSCTNGRIEDFRRFASIVEGRKKAIDTTVWLVPGSKEVQEQIEKEGLGIIIRDAGFEIREPGCSACLAMNSDKIPSGKICLSTSNRNFEGRQGPGARTILCGVGVAAASALTGKITNPQEYLRSEPKQVNSIIESECVVIELENIDTDQIIPARFLKTTSREGFGEKLFFDRPNLLKGDGKILVAGKNFGCGSSREHAAWAITDYGFKAVVSSFFADIFKTNALNNKLLPVQVSSGFIEEIFKLNRENKNITLIIDISKKEIVIKESNTKESFELDFFRQECFIKNYDSIDYLLANIKNIESYEKK